MFFRIADVTSVHAYLMTLLDVTTFLKEYKSEMPANELFSCHIADLLHCWGLISEKTDCIDYQSSSGKGKDCASSVKECSVLFCKVILFWYPHWDMYICEKYYNNDLLLFLKTVHMILKFPDLSLLYMSDIPKWLYKCFKEDKKHKLVKLFLSPSGENCLNLILGMFEQSLSFQHFTNVKDVLLCESRETSAVYWEKIILYFKKICNTYKIIPDINFYHQITMVI